MRKINYLWRLIGTGWAFAFIFFGGGILAVTLLPILAWLPGHSRQWTQSIIHTAFRFYVGVLRFIGLLNLEIEGLDRLKNCGGKIVVANHPSLLDVVFLMSVIPRAQCIVKEQLWQHPLLGPLMRQAGYIRNNLDPQDLLDRCRETLREGNSLIIFPEGTRSQPGQLLRFQRGFANLAIFAEANIMPVYITCTPPTLIKGEPWWKIPPNKPLFQISVGEPLDIRAYLLYGYRGVSARRLVRALEASYQEKMTHARP